MRLNQSTGRWIKVRTVVVCQTLVPAVVMAFGLDFAFTMAVCTMAACQRVQGSMGRILARYVVRV
jgi:hypothetical protein